MLLKLVLKKIQSCLRPGLFLCAGLIALPFGVRAQVLTNLNQALVQSNLNLGGVFVFNTNVVFTVTNPLVVKTNVVLDATGFSVTFSGNNAKRVFNVVSNASLTLINMNIINGRETNGGGFYVDAGSTLNLLGCILSGHNAFGPNGRDGINASSGNNGGHGAPGTNAMGGAIYNLGDVNIGVSLISSNTASGGDGGNGGRGGDSSSFGGDGGNGGNAAFGWGGGIYNAGNLFIIDSTLTNNFALGGFGGAVGLGGTAPWPGLPGRGGTGAAGAGGAIYNVGSAIITNSTVVTNAALGGDTAHAGVDEDGKVGGIGDGGGIFNGGILTVVNSTFTKNFAEGGKGGNAYSGNFIDAGNGGSGRGGAIFSTNVLNIRSSTLAVNNATGGPGGTSPLAGHSGSKGADLGGNIYRLSGQVTVNNTILAKGATGANYASANASNVLGAFNLSSDATPANFPLASKNKNALLLPLGDFGGRTTTMALTGASPAIDAGDPNSCEPADQRGVPRPYGARCDIGAYEYIPAFTIRGRLLDGTNGVGQIPVVAVGVVTNVALSLTNGNYTITNLPPGEYAVRVSPSFTPAEQLVNLTTNRTNINFTFLGAKLSFPNYSTEGGNSFRFLVSGKANQIYQVQRSTNLVDWTENFTITNATNGLFISGGTNTANLPYLFFRVITP